VFLGSSRQLVVGPEGSISTLVAAAILPLSAAASPQAVELAAMLALLVAACFALAWAFRLGWIADYFSRPVLIGYIHGVAVILIIGQLGKLLGLSIDAREPLPQLWEVIRELGGVSGATIALALLSLAALLAFRLVMPRLPAALIVVVVAIGLSWALDFGSHGASGLIDPQAWRALAAVDPVEVAIAGVTTGCVVVFGVLEALVVAVGLSMIDTVRRSARPHDAVLGWVARLGRYADVSLHPSARVTPGVVVYRLDDRLFFANARYFKGRVREAIRAAPAPVTWLVFDAEAVTLADSTGLEALTDLTRGLRRDGITLVLARLRTRMLEHLEAAGVLDAIGRERVFPSVRAAVDACAGSLVAET
jgi:MFS superfamily sulfate permease-like transporter